MGRLFGTDGIRGIANKELTAELAMNVGRAVASVLSNGSRRRPVIVIGSDTRISSDMLSSALICGICSVGADVIQLGVIPTPAVAYLIGKYKADAGIVVSASHNTAEYNGIKVFGGDGFKLPDALEEQIEALVLDGAPLPISVGKEIGKLTYAQHKASKDYIAHVKSGVLYSLDGLRIAVDCANGAASATAEKLFSELGATVTMIGNKPDGININEGCGSTHIENVARAVRELGLDCGVAFDGDADRCICVDENGNVVDGDVIMAVCALDLLERGRLSNKTVVGTIMANLGFSKFCEENGIRFIATKVGDKYVLEEMLLEDHSFGGEQSGHIIFRDFATTGDGQLTAVQLLSLARRKGKPLSELCSIIKKYPQTTVNVKVSNEGKLAFYTSAEVKEIIDKTKEELGSSGRVVVRPSGTEPLIRVMIEAESDEVASKYASRIAKVIEEKLAKA